MPRKGGRRRAKEYQGFIPDLLTDEELGEITYCLAVEKVWFNSWRDDPDNHWVNRGEDGWRDVEIAGEIQHDLLIDMRGHFFKDHLGNEHEIGWVTAQRIVPWEQGVVPTTINRFLNRWFGLELFHYGLFFYYQVQSFATIVGGRGSGKTLQLALAAIAWVSLHPGENWLHFAYMGEQARIAFEIIREHGEETTQDEGSVGVALDERRNWFKIFSKPDGFRESPYPRIVLRSWDEHDHGNRIEFRPLNPGKGATSARSFSCAACSMDEVTRDVDSESVLNVAEATVRGINMWKFRKLPKETREHVRQLIMLRAQLSRKGFDDPEHEEHSRFKAIEDQIYAYGLTRRGTRLRCGNSGAPWLSVAQNRAKDAQNEEFFRRVPFWINPFLTQQDKKSYMRQYADPMQAATELMASDPMGASEFFGMHNILHAESQELSSRLDPEKPGHVFNNWGGFAVHFELPYEPGYRYISTSDPGTGRVPDRNSYCVMVWRVHLDKPLAEMVYFDWGAVGFAAGSWLPYLSQLEYVRKTYNMVGEDICVIVGGQESGLLEAHYAGQREKMDLLQALMLAEDEEEGSSLDVITAAMRGHSGNGLGGDLAALPTSSDVKNVHLNYVRPVHVAGDRRARVANLWRELLAKQQVKWPDILLQLRMQHSQWNFADKKMAQDLVMACFAGAPVLYQTFIGMLKDAQEHEAQMIPRAQQLIRARRGAGRRYYTRT